jgi:hypothetical protein
VSIPVFYPHPATLHMRKYFYSIAFLARIFAFPRCDR